MNPEDYEDFEPMEDDLDFDDDDDDLDEVMDLLDYDDDDDDDDDVDVDDIDDIERKRRKKYFRRKWRRKMRRSRSTFKKARPRRGRWATVQQVEKGFQRSDRNDKVLGKRVTAIKKSAARFATRTARDHKNQQGEIDNIKQMTLFTSLLGGDKKLKITGATDASGASNAALNGVTLNVEDDSDKLDKFLPFLMMGGMGDSKSGGFGSNPMMMFLLMDALGD